ISQRALDLGLDGLMIESHCDPTCALSDAKQQLTPEDFGKLLSSLVVREPDSDSPEYKENIDQLRAQIDIIDENLLYILNTRMNVSRSIGNYKKEHNIAILQTSRWDEVLSGMQDKAKAYGLSEEFIAKVFTAIHDESVQEQNKILSKE
ncbi:MAG: chorismate mutase, partial [Candidatus Cryptobacteroides sp.]